MKGKHRIQDVQLFLNTLNDINVYNCAVVITELENLYVVNKLLLLTNIINTTA